MVSYCLLVRKKEWRSPRGERGLKLYVPSAVRTVGAGRAPRGERGLKLFRAPETRRFAWSLPPRGAWIEIWYVRKGERDEMVAPPAGSVD